MTPEAQEHFRRAAKNALIVRRISMTTLARTINRSRTSVSLAINHGVFPATRKLIAKELDLSLR